MDMTEYQEDAIETAIYPDNAKILYPTLGLVGEAGEVAEKVKKVIRDEGGVFTEEKKVELAKELGDVLWYIANIAADIDMELNLIATMNLDKLASRAERINHPGPGIIDNGKLSTSIHIFTSLPVPRYLIACAQKNILKLI